MTRPFEAERKAIRKAANTTTALSDALKASRDAAERIDANPFAALIAANEARRHCKALAGLADQLGLVDAALADLATRAESLGERAKARLVGELDDALRQDGLELQGRLPSLRCGPLTLELEGGRKPQVRIQYGPGIALLDTAPLDPAAIAERVRAQLRELEGGGELDSAAFLDEVRAAWRAAVARGGGAAGDKAPIIAVLGEVAAGRQTQQWRSDPTRSAYRPYARVRFGHDLGRLRSRRTADGAELVLTVATRDQTKRAADHLWIAGTHYAWLAFRT